MKRLLLLACLLLALPAHAYIITAELDQFTSRSATIAGIGTGGGIGEFTVIGTDAGSSGDPILDLIFADGETFLAFCLEPEEYVSRGITYQFELVDLALAPTSSNAGPMGATGEKWIEKVLSYTSYGNVDELVAGSTVSRQHAFQAALYEAGYEDPIAATFDFGAGDAVVTSAGALGADLTSDQVNANSFVPQASLDEVNSYGLLNIASEGPGTRSLYTGQDFMVFTRAESVPEPDLAALMGLGLMGLGFTLARRGRRR